jgi:WD40 repeat protein
MITMSTKMRRGSSAVAAVIVLSGCGLGAAGAARAAVTGPARPHAVTAGTATADTPGTQLWVQRYVGEGFGDDEGWAVAVSPDGAKVFVTGDSRGGMATIAYSASTGAQLWVTRASGIATSMAVSPDGHIVFVTGGSTGGGAGDDYATRAYSSATGAPLWTVRYNGPSSGGDVASKVAVSPDGRTVFVTGTSEGGTSGRDYATVAYRASTGARLWVRRYNGPGDGIDATGSVAVSPGGRRIFVTGSSWGGPGARLDYATVAYSAATGARLWVKRYAGPGGGDSAGSVAVSPSGTTVFVTGKSRAASSGRDYATVAYRASTGMQLWAARLVSPSAQATAVSSAGNTVFVTGTSRGNYATVAYRSSTGDQMWERSYNGPAKSRDEAGSLAVSRGGRVVYVAGTSVGTGTDRDYATVAYSGTTGARLWVQRYNSPYNGPDFAMSVAVSPGGAMVVVTGASQGAEPGQSNYATVAYRG